MTDLPTGDIVATLNYVRNPPTDDPAIPMVYDAIGGKETTMRLEARDVRVSDGRANPAGFSLDREGFTLVPHRTSVTDFLDRVQTNEIYPAEAAALVREVTGAVETRATLTNVRFAREHRADYAMTSDHKPAGFAHADFTDVSARIFFESLGYKDSDYARWAIYNVWQVWSAPPQDNSLAVCDIRSVSKDDENIVQIKLDVPGQPPVRNWTTVFHPNAANHWYYFSNMTVDEVLIFKAFDSDPARTQRVPHTAIHNPLVGPEYGTRQSIETRVLALYR